MSRDGPGHRQEGNRFTLEAGGGQDARCVRTRIHANAARVGERAMLRCVAVNDPMGECTFAGEERIPDPEQIPVGLLLE